MCYVHCDLNFSLLVTKFHQTVLNMRLYHRLNQRTGLKLIEMWN